MNELDVKRRFEAIFPGKNVEIDHRLLGGMSNYTFVVKMDDELYTYRIPGDYAEYFVDREIEKDNLRLLEKLHLSNETIYLDVNTGEKIAKYIPGVSLHQLSEYPYELVSELLKKIHNSGILAKNDYNPFERLEKYENYVKELGFVHPEKYNVNKTKFLEYKDFLNSFEKVLCHGDSQPSNFILHNDDLYSVDFEFTGNNDLIYDIACFANIKLSDGEKLLEVYFGQINNELLKRFYLWRAFQAMQWFNVATFKDLKGMSAKLKIDFKVVSEKYLELARSLIEKVENIF